jgi:hypothetical protein
MFLEDQPDDLIQCLVLGAYNSQVQIHLESAEGLVSAPGAARPVATWRELQTIILEGVAF